MIALSPAATSPPSASVAPASHTSPAQTSTQVECTHCRLPMSIVAGNSGPHFCCNGCETAHAVITSCGLDGYYALRDRLEASAASADHAPRRYSEFDDPTFHKLYCREAPDGLVQTELLLEGVHCVACVWLVERLPRVNAAVLESTLDLRRCSVRLTFDPRVGPLSRIAADLDALGYPPHPARRAAQRDARRAEDRQMLVKLAVAGACAGNIMLLFFALYAGMFEGIEGGFEQLFRWAAMILNTICLAWPGLVFARSALGALRARTINLDVPIAMGLYLGGAWGIWKTIAGEGDLYFDSISALIFFLLIGRYVQQRQQRFASDALELLFNLAGSTAHRVGADGACVDVPTESLHVGETVEVRAGETIPADGVVLLGNSKVDCSILTGESRPLTVNIGDSVAAGSVNLQSVLRVTVVATGESTRIGKLLRMVEDAQARRAPIVRLADRWGAWLLYGLLLLAAATLIFWWPISPTLAFDRAAALLIATCPCGLGLATPLAMTVAVGLAARCGILIKGGEILELLARPGERGTIVLDKTGTMTEGVLSVARWTGPASVLELASALCRTSSHPVSKAVVRHLNVAPRLKVAHSHEHRGMGLEGTIIEETSPHEWRVLLGRAEFLGTQNVAIPPDLAFEADRGAANGLSPLFVAVDGVCAGLAEMGDRIRPDTAAAVRRFRAFGWSVRVLSGDREEVVRHVASEAGISPQDALGGICPEAKLNIVRELTSKGRTVMIGDGVNDAAALAAASVGVAVRGGAEASLAAADVSLTSDGLLPVVELLEGARRLMWTIYLTITTSLLYNLVAASLALLGYISPLLAAIIMPASSLTAVAICMKSRPFRPSRRAMRGQTSPGRPNTRGALV